MTRETTGSYLTGTMGNVSVNQNLYQNESSVTNYTEGVNTLMGGEFGLFRVTERATFKLGFEILIPKAIKVATASSGGVTQYNINSTGIIYSPKFGMDLNMLFGSMYRWIISGSIGMARLSQKNEYKETILPVGDHTVEYMGDTITWTASTGIEYYIMDTTTLVFEVGYRSLNFQSIKYAKSVTTFTGEQNGSDTAHEYSGADRTANFSGIVGGLGFRFYF